MNSAATNYAASPDVQECCTFDSKIKPASSGKTVKVKLTFSLNPSTLQSRVPFTNSKDTFCTTFLNDVRSDVACALDIPIALVSADVTTSCGWTSGSSITFDLSLHELDSAMTLKGLKSPSDLAADLVKQYADKTSRLWKGYLTKTLLKDKGLVAESTSSSTTAASTGTTITPSAGSTSTGTTSAPSTGTTSTEEGGSLNASGAAVLRVEAAILVAGVTAALH